MRIRKCDHVRNGADSYLEDQGQLMGINMRNMLRFVMDYPGWHTFDKRCRATVDAVKSLARLGLIEVNGTQFRARQAVLDSEEREYKKKYDELHAAILLWAKTPGNHGGNPYCHSFMKLVDWKEVK